MVPIKCPDIETISKACPIEPDTIIEALRNGTLPTMLLYDERGLQLFEKITYNPHYYLTECEIEILRRHSDQLALQIQDSIIIELGSGALRKTSLILQAVEKLGIETDYYALDLDRNELQRSLIELTRSTAFKHVKLHGLHADYNDIHKFLQECERRVTILWMGSSVGNFDRGAASEFLLGIKQSMRPGDSIVIGVDHRNDQQLVQTAYNDPEGDSEAFELNALDHANRIMEREVFNLSDWRYEGKYDEVDGRHEARFFPKVNVTVTDDLTLAANQRIRIERSYKYSEREVQELFDHAQLDLTQQWTDSKQLYSLYLTSVPISYMSDSTMDLKPLPTLDEWQQLWNLWDTVTLKMVPEAMLDSKPIDLRNPCIFYIGHIPTFLDIHLSRVGNGKYTNTAYTQIFERGIDPDVDDPTQCHSHSEIPDTWPALAEMLQFRDMVRRRLREVYTSGQVADRRVARAVFTVYEHEAMHLETFLYMHIQADWTSPPPGIQGPQSDAKRTEISPATWIDMSAAHIDVGMDDPEDASTGTYFGWDNEKPRRSVAIKPYSIQSRPISNREYSEYLESTQNKGQRCQYPKSWTSDMQVKTVFGPVSLQQAGNWPVMASYDELAKYAAWKGARLPTYEELRHFIDVQTPNKTPFNDIHGRCVNFHQWHPSEMKDVPDAQIYCGAWEWTSTHFQRTPGFVTSKIYPGYSEDFFDSKHNIVLGGSWATISRIAARKSFVNWYQRNYEYSWSGARLVKLES